MSTFERDALYKFVKGWTFDDFFIDNKHYQFVDEIDGTLYFRNAADEIHIYRGEPGFMHKSGMKITDWIAKEYHSIIERPISEPPVYDPFEIDLETRKYLYALGMIGSADRNYNIGKSNYSEKFIQPWSIWKDWNLDPWDADIIKRIARTKEEEGKTLEESRIQDYEKIIHICKEKIRQLQYEVRQKQEL